MTLRIGILGAARVATYAMIDATRAVDGVMVQAVAARDPARARAYADEHGIFKVYPDYQALIEADDVDAVYVALPPNLHAHWSVAALAAGKPVLCEKPFALTIADAEAMVGAENASGGLLMEAQHSHYHPLSAFMRELVQGGELGIIKQVDAMFDAPVPVSSSEIRYDRAVGGGAIWDLGVYPAYWLRSALGEEPEVVSATQRRAEGGADIATEACLRTSYGTAITMRCAMDQPFAAHIRFTGDKGWLDIRNPLAPHMGHICRWEIIGTAHERQFDAPTTYALQLAAFRDAIAHGTPVTTRGVDSIATIRLLTAIDTLARKV